MVTVNCECCSFTLWLMERQSWLSIFSHVCLSDCVLVYPFSPRSLFLSLLCSLFLDFSLQLYQNLLSLSPIFSQEGRKRDRKKMKHRQTVFHLFSLFLVFVPSLSFTSFFAVSYFSRFTPYFIMCFILFIFFCVYFSPFGLLFHLFFPFPSFLSPVPLFFSFSNFNFLLYLYFLLPLRFKI